MQWINMNLLGETESVKMYDLNLFLNSICKYFVENIVFHVNSWFIAQVWYCFAPFCVVLALNL